MTVHFISVRLVLYNHRPSVTISLGKKSSKQNWQVRWPSKAPWLYARYNSIQWIDYMQTKESTITQICYNHKIIKYAQQQHTPNPLRHTSSHLLSVSYCLMITLPGPFLTTWNVQIHQYNYVHAVCYCKVKFPIFGRFQTPLYMVILFGNI